MNDFIHRSLEILHVDGIFYIVPSVGSYTLCLCGWNCVVSIGGVFNSLDCTIIYVGEMNDIRKLSCKFCLIQNLARTHEGYKHHHYNHQVLNMTRRMQHVWHPHKEFIILYVSLLKC